MAHSAHPATNEWLVDRNRRVAQLFKQKSTVSDDDEKQRLELEIKNIEREIKDMTAGTKPPQSSTNHSSPITTASSTINLQNIPENDVAGPTRARLPTDNRPDTIVSGYEYKSRRPSHEERVAYFKNTGKSRAEAEKLLKRNSFQVRTSIDSPIEEFAVYYVTDGQVSDRKELLQLNRNDNVLALYGKESIIIFEIPLDDLISILPLGENQILLKTEDLTCYELIMESKASQLKLISAVNKNVPKLKASSVKFSGVLEKKSVLGWRLKDIKLESGLLLYRNKGEKGSFSGLIDIQTSGIDVKKVPGSQNQFKILSPDGKTYLFREPNKNPKLTTEWINELRNCVEDGNKKLSIRLSGVGRNNVIDSQAFRQIERLLADIESETQRSCKVKELRDLLRPLLDNRYDKEFGRSSERMSRASKRSQIENRTSTVVLNTDSPDSGASMSEPSNFNEVLTEITEPEEIYDQINESTADLGQSTLSLKERLGLRSAIAQSCRQITSDDENEESDDEEEERLQSSTEVTVNENEDLRASNDVVSVNPNAESKVTEKRSQEEVEVQQVLSVADLESSEPDVTLEANCTNEDGSGTLASNTSNEGTSGIPEITFSSEDPKPSDLDHELPHYASVEAKKQFFKYKLERDLSQRTSVMPKPEPNQVTNSSENLVKSECPQQEVQRGTPNRTSGVKKPVAPPPPISAPPPPPSPGGFWGRLKSKPPQLKTIQVRPIHKDSIALKNAIWDTECNNNVIGGDIDESEKDEIVTLFALKSNQKKKEAPVLPAAAAAVDGTDNSQQSRARQIENKFGGYSIGGPRAQRLEMFFKQHKFSPTSDVFMEFFNIKDKTNQATLISELNFLQPTQLDIDVFNLHGNNLDETTPITFRQMSNLCKDTHYKEKLEVLKTINEIEEQGQLVETNLTKVIKLCFDLENNDEFKRVLKHCLKLINFINEKNHKDRVLAFSLVETLPNLSQTKSTVKPDYTLLHSLVAIIRRQDPDLLHKLSQLQLSGVEVLAPQSEKQTRKSKDLFASLTAEVRKMTIMFNDARGCIKRMKEGCAKTDEKSRSFIEKTEAVLSVECHCMITSLDAKVEELTQSYDRLMKLFAQDRATDPAQFFSVVNKFLRDLCLTGRMIADPIFGNDTGRRFARANVNDEMQEKIKGMQTID